jgi:hypothetical protein
MEKMAKLMFVTTEARPEGSFRSKNMKQSTCLGCSKWEEARRRFAAS